MSKMFHVNVSLTSSSDKLLPNHKLSVQAELSKGVGGLRIKLMESKHFEIYRGRNISFTVTPSTECCRILPKSYLFKIKNNSIVLTFNNRRDFRSFHESIKEAKSSKVSSIFNDRTDAKTAELYFEHYGYLYMQQNMLEDDIRVKTYKHVILSNRDDFEGKVVLDVGTGIGILSVFAVQAGAKMVYAVEASKISRHARVLVEANGLSDKIKVIHGKIEEIELPEKVNVIISEPLGYMLINERMLETYLHAKKWLLPGGKMYPSSADLHVVPFSDNDFYNNQNDAPNFWAQENFHGLNLNPIKSAAVRENIDTPIIGTFNIQRCLSKSVRHTINFNEAHENDLHIINMPLEFQIERDAICHGLAFWFDVAFRGITNTIWLSTCPIEPLTHWHQARCLLETPIFVQAGETLFGQASFVANDKLSYDIRIQLQLNRTMMTSSGTYDLQNPKFQLRSRRSESPIQIHHTSPSERLWNLIENHRLLA